MTLSHYLLLALLLLSCGSILVKIVLVWSKCAVLRPSGSFTYVIDSLLDLLLEVSACVMRVNHSLIWLFKNLIRAFNLKVVVLPTETFLLLVWPRRRG